MHTSDSRAAVVSAVVSGGGRTALADLLPQRGPSTLLGYVAGFWLTSGLLHLVIFAFADTAWSGAVSWRKPIVFSVSFGLMLLAFGWVLDRLPDRGRLAWSLAVVFALSSSIEVGLITLQQWRGRPSHFNTFEGGDATIFIMMGVSVGFISLALLGLFVWSLIERPPNRLDRTAAIAGMAMIVSGLGVGQWIINLGNTYVERFDRVPETVINGEAGVAKFPHAVAFHGIQVFMVVAVLLARSGVGRSAARRLMGTVVAAYTGLLVFSALQSYGGRAPFDLDVVSGGLLAVSGIVLATSVATVVGLWLVGAARPDGAISPPESDELRRKNRETGQTPAANSAVAG